MRDRCTRAKARLVVSLSLGALVVTAPPAIQVVEAKKRKGDGAADLEALGRRAFAREQWDDAIAAFEGAYQANPLPKYLFNIARCHQKAGDLGRASHYFERYVEAAPEAKDRRQVHAVAKMLRLKLAKSFTRVQVASSPGGALVRVKLEGGDRRLEGGTPFAEWLPFGAHNLEVRKEGYEPVRRELVVRPDAPVEMTVELAAIPSPVVEPVAEAPEPDPTRADEVVEEDAVVGAAAPVPAAAAAGAGWPAWIAAGAGVAMLAGGGVFGLLAGSAIGDRDALYAKSAERMTAPSYAGYESHDDTARSRALTANVLLVAGAVTLAAGIAWLVLDSPDAEHASATVTPGPVGLGVTLRWGGVR